MTPLRAQPRLLAQLLCAALCAIPALGLGADDDRWRFHVVPYLWLPAFDQSSDATLSRLDGGTVRVNASSSPDNYLSDLGMAFMGMAEARKGPWSIYTDVIYTSFGNQTSKIRDVTGPAGFLRSEISRNAKMGLSATIWTLAGGYRAIDRDHAQVDLMAGTRYLTMDSDLTLDIQGADGRFSRQRKSSLDQEVWQGLIGLRGEIPFAGTRWYLPFYADLGSGGSNWSWQAMLGAGYRFDWGEVVLAYRALSYDFDKDDAELTLYGPGLGVGFSW